MFADIRHLWAVFGRPIEGRLGDFVVGDGYAEARAEDANLVFVKFFLVVGNILALTCFAQAISFNGFGEDDGWGALVRYGLMVGGVYLFGVVAAAAHLLQLIVGVVFDHFGQLRVGAEEVFANIVAVGNRVFLVLAVDDLVHAVGQATVVVLFEQRVPVVTPDNFDDIPVGPAEGGFKFLDDLAIAAYRAVEALQVAVNDPDEIVEVLARG